MARLPYVSEDASPEVRELYAKITSRGVRLSNLFRMMAHNPSALRSVMRLGTTLLQRDALDPRLRELAICLVARLVGSKYEWQQHQGIAQEAGVRADQIAAIDSWASSPAFDESEKAVLRYVDQVTTKLEVDDATFDAVRKLFSESELMTLTLVIGYYGLVARVLMPMKVDLEQVPVSAKTLLGDRG